MIEALASNGAFPDQSPVMIVVSRLDDTVQHHIRRAEAVDLRDQLSALLAKPGVPTTEQLLVVALDELANWKLSSDHFETFEEARADAEDDIRQEWTARQEAAK
jgi:hypothetical protein